MWTHSKKNLLENQMKRLVRRNGAKIVRTINTCSLTKSQFMDLACLLIDTCSGTDKAPINDRKNFYVVKFSGKHFPNDRYRQKKHALRLRGI